MLNHEPEQTKNSTLNLIDRAREEYPSLWRKFTREWRSQENEDAAWMIYAANYLLRTAGVRWTIDPYCLMHRIQTEHDLDLSGDLSGLEMIVLSHKHNDHLDLKLLRALQDLPAQWVIPEFMLEIILDNISLPRERIITARPGTPIQLRGLTLTPFNGLHIREVYGVPELGYLAEFNHKRWLFPGDIRNYDFSQFPPLGQLDGSFAHLWLGKGRALDQTPPFIDAFVQFFTRLNPKRLVITHMHEIGRVPEELWDLHHYQMVLEKFHSQTSSMSVAAALTGQKVSL